MLTRSPKTYEDLILEPIPIYPDEVVDAWIKAAIERKIESRTVLAPVLPEDQQWRCYYCPVKAVCDELLQEVTDGRRGRGEGQQRSNRVLRSLCILVMCVAAVFMLIAASIRLAWNPFAFDMHLPQLTYPGALGLTGLILIAISLIEATILVAHKDWGD